MQHSQLLYQLVQYTFNVSFLAFAGSFVFFLASRDLVHQRYKVNMVVSACISGIAAYMYHSMKGIYSYGQVFPTEMRYIDWLVTTPLMLVQFSLLLGLRLNSGLVWKLMFCDLFMIVSGYLGETQGFRVGALPLRWMLFAFGMTGWLGIMVYLYRGIIEQAKLDDNFVLSSVKTLTKFVTFGWLLYPIGYVARALFPDYSDYCQLAYNVGDLINKVGFGAVLYVYGSSALEASHPELFESNRGSQKKASASASAPEMTPAPAPAPAKVPVPTSSPQALPVAPQSVVTTSARLLDNEPLVPRPGTLASEASSLLSAISSGAVLNGTPQAPARAAQPDGPGPSAADYRSMQQDLLKRMRTDADYKAKLEQLREEVESELSRSDDKF